MKQKKTALHLHQVNLFFLSVMYKTNALFCILLNWEVGE